MSYILALLRQRFPVMLAGCFVTLGVLTPACGGDPPARVAVTVELGEFSVQPAVEEAVNGRIAFEVTNAGAVTHRFVVVKSDFPPSQLPVVDGAVDLGKLNVEGQLEPLAPGASATLEVNLSAGKYVLLCTIVERPPSGPVVSHYEQGMYAGFFVES